MDAARTARRLGAASVTIAYRRSRDEMPAHHVEAEDAEKEGVAFRLLVAPAEVLGNAEGAVSGLRCVEMRLGAPDASGRRSAEPIPGSDVTIEADVIIAAIGMRPDTAAFGDRVATLKNGRLACDVGDLPDRGAARVRRRRRGPRAHGHHPRRGGGPQGRPPGRRLAQRPRLRRLGHPPPRGGQAGRPGAPEGVHAVGGDAGRHGAPVVAHGLPRGRGSPHRGGGPRAAGRCIDCAVCSECNECVSACPVDGCIDLRATDQEREVRVGRRRRVDRLQALPRRPQARVRVRRLQERDHRHADGPAARPHAAVQHDPAPG